jgi:hypothetical protein
MNTELNERVLNRLFTNARTHNGFLDKPITDEQCQAI